ncbi:uncharacterized protein LOC131025966 [Salvia miltiorrhiza]|uniref:uncharacterized protein LOC131025966 n=1 Tax=Salvia miltiorrhiza TaxID=226208 RepID=UPI0025ABE599|nr:uncharacterized protein LOC131025966 [Salvia miltiorrhiza]
MTTNQHRMNGGWRGGRWRAPRARRAAHYASPVRHGARINSRAGWLLVDRGQTRPLLRAPMRAARACVLAHRALCARAGAMQLLLLSVLGSAEEAWLLESGGGVRAVRADEAWLLESGGGVRAVRTGEARARVLARCVLRTQRCTAWPFARCRRAAAVPRLLLAVPTLLEPRATASGCCCRAEVAAAACAGDCRCCAAVAGRRGCCCCAPDATPRLLPLSCPCRAAAAAHAGSCCGGAVQRVSRKVAAAARVSKP